MTTDHIAGPGISDSGETAANGSGTAARSGVATARLDSASAAWWTRYAIAIGTVTIAVVLRLAVRQFVGGEESPFLLVFAGVLVSGAFGGLGPGLLATGLGASVDYFFFDPPDAGWAAITFADALRVALFLVEGIFISWIGNRLQSARRRAERSEAETRRLEQKVMDISEDERRRIGQDLHDGLGQHLTGVAFLSKALQTRLTAKRLPEAADATRIASLVSESIGQTRALAKGLAPVGLEDGGVSSALSQLAASTGTVFDVACQFTCQGVADQLPLAVAIHIYRIAQEAVSNAMRHGKATRIDISLTISGGKLRLEITDNGIGISANAAAPPPGTVKDGMGLQIMRFRAKMIGGTLSIQSLQSAVNDNGTGTRVVCIVPLPASTETKPRPIDDMI